MYAAIPDSHNGDTDPRLPGLDEGLCHQSGVVSRPATTDDGAIATAQGAGKKYKAIDGHGKKAKKPKAVARH